MQFSVAKVDPNGGPVKIDLVIGKHQLGRYVMEIYDPEKQKSRILKEGNNADNIADSYSTTKPNNLIGKEFLMKCVIYKQGDGSGDIYSAHSAIIQDGNPVEGGVLFESGLLEETRTVVLGYQIESV